MSIAWQGICAAIVPRRARPFPVRTDCREVAIQQVRCDVEAVVAVRGRLELLVPPELYAIFVHQTANAAVTHGQSQLFQFFGHAWATITARRLLELIPDVGQHDQILALAGADGTVSPGPIAARADVHDLTQPVHRDVVPVFLDEGKPHLLLSAKNTGAFFSTF